MNTAPNTMLSLDHDFTEDCNVREFLQTIVNGQCLGLAFWAKKILYAGEMSEKDLERCFVLGFSA